MELKSFKELLLKKAEGNPYLQTLIEYAKDDLIVDGVIESLLKMAEPSAAMGRGANSALTSYAASMDNSDVEQIRDALAHHISHYRGALKAGNRAVADAHLNKIIPMMHLAGRAGRHSNGKMVLDYVSTTPWETNYTTHARHEGSGLLKEGTKDLGRRPKKMRGGVLEPHQRTLDHRGVPDYRYLEMPPHALHETSAKMPHKGGYPFEEIQLGNPAKRDAGKAYLPIEDVGPVNQYVPHPFDQHPVHAVADTPEHHLTPEEKEKFVNELAAWKSGSHHQKWLQDQKAKFQADKEAYLARGTQKPKHVYEGLKLLEQPAHAKAQAAATAQSEAPASPEELDVSALPPALQVKYGANKPKQSAASQVASKLIEEPSKSTPQTDEVDWSKLPAALRQKYGK